MFCPNCGKPVPDQAKFCGECGCALTPYQNSGNTTYTGNTLTAESPVSGSGNAPYSADPGSGFDNAPKSTAPEIGSHNTTYHADPFSVSNKASAETEPTASPSGFSAMPDASHNRIEGATGIAGAAKILIPVLSLILIAVLAGVIFTMRKNANSSNASSVAEGTAAQASDAAAGGEGAKADSESNGSTDTANSGSAASETVQPVASLPRPSFYGAPQTAEAAVTPNAPQVSVDSNFGNVINADAFYFANKAQNMMLTNGFYVHEGTAGEEFFEIYEMNRYTNIPSFVTVDSMMHTYHLYFSYLMKQIEKNALCARLMSLSARMAESAAQHYEVLKGTEWESAALREAAFFGVALSLLDPAAPEINAVPEAASIIQEELALIHAAEEITTSPLLNTGDDHSLEDYTQYIPRGYYEGDPQLESYFRAMMWYGRMNFAQKNEELDRTSLLITLSLNGDALSEWEAIYTVTRFFAGASDDCGYYEYRPVIDAAYGSSVSAEDLPGNDTAFALYRTQTALLAPPKINSIAVEDTGTETDHLKEAIGFRFMGQRFTIDAAIMQNLVYNRVGTQELPRMMPNALDVPAAFGSDAALSILEAKGETNYENYMENMSALRTELSSADDSLWYASLYSQWLHTLKPLTERKGSGYPAFMQTEAWAKKNLQSFLGSYTELKHDTVLYAKQLMVEMGGDYPEDVDDRGYVEAEPQVFARLQSLTEATILGLSNYGLLGDEDRENLKLLSSLSGQLAAIANKELTGELPTEEEFELIRGYGGQLEHFWHEVCKHDADNEYFTSREFPAAIVTDIATDPNGSVLEIGTGKCSEIYVIVPVEGVLRIARGSVFSFYQFTQPASERLTDSKWRQMMGIELNDQNMYQQPVVPMESWTQDFQMAHDDYS